MRNHATDAPGNATRDPRSRIPSVDQILRSDSVAALIGPYGRDAVVGAIREQLETLRRSSGGVSSNNGWSTSVDAVADLCASRLRERFRRRPVDVINATGVIIHTNLGRAPLSEAAKQAAIDAGAYVDLEFDVPSGARGTRHQQLAGTIRLVTGAEDGIAVNNNAAATLLVLAAIAGEGRQVIVSRSEAVEIGGGFRIPDVMAQSRSELVEVGTTNRTYASDYEGAVTKRTAAILKVHRSNFTISGFTHEAATEELVSVGRRHQVPVLHDLGSGALLETSRYGLDHEPTVQESVQAGVDLVMFSGDKLLGGPQAGIIAGKSDLISKIKSHPLARATRIDKMTIAALNETLLTYARGTAEQELPVWRVISASSEELRERANRWADESGAGSVVEGWSTIGGGSAPGQTLPTWLLRVHTSASPSDAARQLRLRDVPIIGRVSDDSLYLDPRTVLTQGEDDAIIEALRELKSQ